MNNPSRWLRFRAAKVTGFLPVCLVLLSVVTVVRGAGGDSSLPQIKLVAPGIWQLHFGNPEQLTPVHFRSTDMDGKGLEQKPFSQSMPLDANNISFQISERGCSVLLPMSQCGHC